MLETALDDKLKLKILLLYLLKKRRVDLKFSYFFFYFFRTNLDAPSTLFRAPTFFSKTLLDLGLEDEDEFLDDDEDLDEEPSSDLGSRRTFCRNLLYFFRELPHLAIEGGCEESEVDLFKKLSLARSKQTNLLVRLMHEYKADPLAILQEWLSDFLDETMEASLEQYEFLETKNLEAFFKLGLSKEECSEEIYDETQEDPQEYDLGLFHEGEEPSELDDATLAVLGDPDLEAEEEGSEYYNFFFLRNREVKKPDLKLGGLFFFDPGFFFYEEGVLSTEVDFFTEVAEPCGFEGEPQTD